MKVFIDTNVLISAALNPAGTAAAAYAKAVMPPNKAVISEQNVEELLRIFTRKFPERLPALKRFFEEVVNELEIAAVPKTVLDSEALLRDAADRPILRAAIKVRADVLLTGDKDFLESDIENPIILSPSEFIRMH